MAKNERPERRVKERRTEERDEINARIAQFKATQERFTREREQFATATWKKALPPEPTD